MLLTVPVWMVVSVIFCLVVCTAVVLLASAFLVAFYDESKRPEINDEDLVKHLTPDWILDAVFVNKLNQAFTSDRKFFGKVRLDRLLSSLRRLEIQGRIESREVDETWADLQDVRREVKEYRLTQLPEHKIPI